MHLSGNLYNTKNFESCLFKPIDSPGTGSNNAIKIAIGSGDFWKSFLLGSQ